MAYGVSMQSGHIITIKLESYLAVEKMSDDEAVQAFSSFVELIDDVRMGPMPLALIGHKIHITFEDYSDAKEFMDTLLSAREEVAEETRQRAQRLQNTDDDEKDTSDIPF